MNECTCGAGVLPGAVHREGCALLPESVPESLYRAIDASGPVKYRSQVLEATIGGVDVRFVVEFAEPITDPAKLPRIRVETVAPVFYKP